MFLAGWFVNITYAYELLPNAEGIISISLQ
jgi:hypothetical protein